MSSNFIAIEFDDHEIRVAASQLQGKHVRVRSAFQVDCSEDDSNKQIGEKLKKALSQKGVSRGDAIIVISRCQVEIREMSVPPAPDNELPSLVRFKSRSEFATATDNWSLDFVPLSGSESTERELLATALSGQVSDRFREICETANLKVKHIVLRPFATMDLLVGEITHDNLCLIVDPNGEMVDLSLVNNGQMILTRSVRSNAHGDLNRLFQQLTMEVQRTLASAAKRIGNKNVDKIIVCGEEKKYEPLGNALEDRLSTKAIFVDPFAKITLKSQAPQSPERYASLVGALMQQGMGRKHEIDFLNPRQPVVERNQHGKKLLIGGLVAAGLCVAGFFGWMSLKQQSTKIDELTKSLGRLRTENSGRGESKSVEQVIGEVEKVDMWLAEAPNWLTQLEQISQRTLDSDTVIVDKFLGSVGNKSPFVNIKGRVKEHAVNTDLQMQLASRFVVDGKASIKTEKSKDYPFTMEADLKIAMALEELQENIDARADLVIDGYDSSEETETVEE